MHQYDIKKARKGDISMTQENTLKQSFDLLDTLVQNPGTTFPSRSDEFPSSAKILSVL